MQSLESYLNTLPSSDEHAKAKERLRLTEDENKRLRLKLDEARLEAARLREEAKKDKDLRESYEGEVSVVSVSIARCPL